MKDSKPVFTYMGQSNGKSEFEDFLKSLSDKERRKVLATIRLVETEGMLVAREMQWVKKIDQNLYELRTRIGREYIRGIYFHTIANQYIITHGFKKKTNQTPVGEIRHAKNVRDEFLKGGK